MSKVLVISSDRVDRNMGGVGVRYWELAHALAKQHQVVLAVPNQTDLTSDTVRLEPYDLEKGDLHPAAEGAEVIVLHGNILHFHPYLRQLEIPIAVDLYVPNLLEGLVWHDQDDWSSWIPAYEEYLRLQLELLRAGDYFFCASERQRDYWLGWLHAQKRLNPHTYRQDPTLRALIDVVPFGVPAGSPQHTHPVVKGAIPGINPADCLILWSGGLWDWLDPLTLIRAVAALVPEHPELKLYFMGTHHPNPEVRGMSMPEKAIALSQELGIFDRHVFFGDWTPYQERESYLAEADLSVVTHPGHIETHFSFRTRVLDCIWAGLPIVITEGDAMAEWVRENDLGVVAPVGEPEAVAAGIQLIIAKGGRDAYAPAFARLREELRWSRVVRPLADFCAQPAFAPDRGQYRTETERAMQAKDAYTEQIIKDKDGFIEYVIQSKDAHIRTLEQQIEEYQRFLPARVYLAIRRRLRRS